MKMSVISKAELRTKILNERKRILPEQRERWDAAILDRIKGLSFPGEEALVYCYVSVRGEAGTEALICWLRSLGIRVALPRVCGKTMAFYVCNSPEELHPGAYGIPEPGPNCPPACEEQAPVIVPGVAFSETFHRIGYGAGYYDRFFAKEPLHPRIAICYDFQLLKDFAADPYDIPMHAIVTPSGIIRAEELNASG